MVQGPTRRALSKSRIGHAAESCEGRARARGCPFGKGTDGSSCGALRRQGSSRCPGAALAPDGAGQALLGLMERG